MPFVCGATLVERRLDGKIAAVRLARPTVETAALALTLAAAATARLSWLDLMEFKRDEANACRLALHVLGYSEPGVGRFFPTAGLVSSVGIPNPPLFVYLVAVPLAIVRSPIAAAAAIAAANVLAVWLTYVVGRRCFSRFVGVTAAAMLALSPWGIVFSRKIWAQDLLPLCTTLFALQLYALLVERRSRAAFGLIVVTGAAIQLHFSACVLVVVLAAALFMSRRWLDRRWTLAAVAVVAALYAPYLALHLGGILHTAHHHERYTGPGFVSRLRAALRDTLGIVGGGSMRYLIGKASALATALSAVLGVLAPAGLVVAARRHGSARSPLATLFCVWYALPLTILTVLEIRPYMHYFIILLPLPYLGLAYLAERVFAWRRAAAAAAIAATLACFGLLDVRFFRTVIHDGGAPGDYGIAYRYQQQAVRFMRGAATGRRIVLGTDLSFAPAKRLTPYRFLLWNADPAAAGRTGRATKAFVLVDGFRAPPPLLRRDPHANSYPRAAFGPLTVVELPPPAASRSHG